MTLFMRAAKMTWKKNAQTAVLSLELVQDTAVAWTEW